MMGDTFKGHERRHPMQGNRFGIDKSINITNVAAALAILITLMTYGSQIVRYLQAVDNKVTVMWQQFILDYPDKASQFDSLFPKR